MIDTNIDMAGKKDRYTYYVYDKDHNLVDKGLATDVARKFEVDTSYIYMAWKQHSQFKRKYTIEREETNPYIPTNIITKKVYINMDGIQQLALERLGELLFDATEGCPLDDYDFDCPHELTCKVQSQAPKCWAKWAINISKKEAKEEEA